jgi:hypothetical protein
MVMSDQEHSVGWPVRCIFKYDPLRSVELFRCKDKSWQQCAFRLPVTLSLYCSRNLLYLLHPGFSPTLSLVSPAR